MQRWLTSYLITLYTIKLYVSIIHLYYIFYTFNYQIHIMNV